MIIGEFERHGHIIESNKFTEHEKNQFKAICNRTANITTYTTALEFLSYCLKKVYNKNVIILIDEYDITFENASRINSYDKIINLIRLALSCALKTNTSLKFAVLTNCLRIHQESILTELDNLNAFYISNNKYSEYFGFTENEVIQMAKYFGSTDKLSEIKNGMADIYSVKKKCIIHGAY